MSGNLILTFLKQGRVSIAENLHRCDLTKEERDRQIRRYAELLSAQAGAPADKPGQDDRVSVGGGRGNKGVASKIAEETGLSAHRVSAQSEPKPQGGSS